MQAPRGIIPWMHRPADCADFNASAGGPVHGTVCSTPNGRLLLTTRHEVGPVCVYDLFTGKEVFRDTANPKPRALSFSPDGRFVAAGSFRRGVYLYRLPEAP
jgi:hypothetical protein